MFIMSKSYDFVFQTETVKTTSLSVNRLWRKLYACRSTRSSRWPSTTWSQFVLNACRKSGDIRQFGMPKEGSIVCQFRLGLVQIAQGIPLYHEVFKGDTAEISTQDLSLQKVMIRFPTKRVIAAVDGRLLSSASHIS